MATSRRHEISSRRSEVLPFQSKRDALVYRLREAILRGEYQVGDRLRQDDIAARFGVSPTPVREALRVLEAERIVDYSPNRGVTVADRGGDLSAFESLRAAVEPLAVQMALANSDEEFLADLESAVQEMRDSAAAGQESALNDAHHRFHGRIFSQSGFSTIQDVIQVVWSRFPWDVLLSMPETRQISVDDHVRLLDVMRSGDNEASMAEYGSHIQSIRRYVRATTREAGTRSPEAADHDSTDTL